MGALAGSFNNAPFWKELRLLHERIDELIRVIGSDE
jgi:hypothetical protein